MSNAYNNIGYIGWTSDAAVLAAAVKGAKHLEREQYVLCQMETFRSSRSM